MYCYVIEVHGREVAYKKLLGAHCLKGFEDPSDTGVYCHLGINFRNAFQTRTSLENPDWAGVDAVTADHMADSKQEEIFDKAFAQRLDHSIGIEDFICWLIPAEAPVRPRATRSAYRL